MQINDNVLKNIDRFSILLFDETQRYKKESTKDEERSKIVDKLLQEQNLKE